MTRANNDRGTGGSSAQAGPVEVRRGLSPRLVETAYGELEARGIDPSMTRVREVRPGVVELDLTLHSPITPPTPPTPPAAPAPAPAKAAKGPAKAAKAPAKVPAKAAKGKSARKPKP